MTTWLNEPTVNTETATVPATSSALKGSGTPATTPTDRVLRATDAALAAVLLLFLALPLVLLRQHRQRQQALGQHGMRFERLGLALPATRAGRVLAAVGAAHWPVLLNILRGDMAWVGLRVRLPGETVSPACSALRPGLLNPWFIRRRTAVDFGTEAEADLHYLVQRGVRHDLGLLLRGSMVALLPPPFAGNLNGRVQLGDVAFDNLNMNEALDRISEMLDGAQAQQVSFVNPDCVNIAAGHRGYRRVLARAALVLPDGIGTKIGSDLLGTPLKQNVNGTDLFPRLCDLLEVRGASVFLLGGQPGVAEHVAAQIGQRWPGLRVAGLRHGFFSVAEEGDVAAQVRASGADLLLVARGAPAQDLFIDRYLPQLGVRVAMGVGGLFDFVSGRISRAPQWMRESGLEWTWRLLQEPGRMWRRYILGNFTFLGRVVLQRAGLRKPAPDTLPVARLASQEATTCDVRAVIFATPCAPTDMPVPADTPTALLPLGCQTVIEQLLAHLAQAAIRHVSLVVCDQPEALRALLGDGSRWGLRLHWHLVKDPVHPYALLASSSLQQARRIVIGHADRCPSVGMLRQLAETDQVLLDASHEEGPQWSGWASSEPDLMRSQTTHLPRAGFGMALQAQGVPTRVSQPGDCLALHSAAAVRQAQPGAGGELGAEDIPASWIRQPWGAMSPLARVSPGAVLVGPVLVGPGCLVERGASVGPDVVLCRDVVVSTDTRIEHSLVLPNTYIGCGLDLCATIVNGARILHLELGVESRMSTADAIVLDLAASSEQRPSWFGRATAAVALALIGPALVWHFTRCRLAGHGPAWTLREVVSGRHAHSQVLRTTPLRMPRPGAQQEAEVWAGLAGLMDVAAGRRSWFGSRPRTLGQWYALRPEWQQVLSSRMVGLLHAPAWQDTAALKAESFAVADVYATRLAPAVRARALMSALMRAISARVQHNP